MTTLLLWLVVLGAMYLETGRRTFPPGRRPFTGRIFLAAIGAGALASGLLYVVLLCLWECRQG